MARLSDRQKQLFELLQARRRLSTAEIKKRFAISSATASRDIHALVVAGMAVKASQGVKLAPPADASIREMKCCYCGRTLKERTLFIIQLENGTEQNACCGRCGLMGLDRADGSSALAVEFLYGRTVNADDAVYILGSSVNLCCEPSVLCFANEEEALSFQNGFGGRLCSMTEAISQLKELLRAGA